MAGPESENHQLVEYDEVRTRIPFPGVEDPQMRRQMGIEFGEKIAGRAIARKRTEISSTGITDDQELERLLEDDNGIKVAAELEDRRILEAKIRLRETSIPRRLRISHSHGPDIVYEVEFIVRGLNSDEPSRISRHLARVNDGFVMLLDYHGEPLPGGGQMWLLGENSDLSVRAGHHGQLFPYSGAPEELSPDEYLFAPDPKILPGLPAPILGGSPKLISDALKTYVGEIEPKSPDDEDDFRIVEETRLGLPKNPK